MFVLKTEQENELIFDYGQGTATLYYREPGTKEKLEYQSRLTKMTDEGLRRDVAGANIWGGKAVCTGLKEGDFGIPDPEDPKGKPPIPISSDPKSKHYREDWLDLMESHQPEFFGQLGSHAFAPTGIRIKREDDPKKKKTARSTGGEK